MIEFVRFGAAWVAVLILAGLSSVPPDPEEFTCCLDQTELKNSTISEWLYDQFVVYTSHCWQSLRTVKADATRLAGLCRKIENEVWARVTDENQFRVNGEFLSAYCDIQEYVVNMGVTAWSDGQRALGVMLEEISSGVGLTTSFIKTVVVSILDTVLECIRSIWNLDYTGFIFSVISCVYGFSMFSMIWTATDFIASQFSKVWNLPGLNAGMFMTNMVSGSVQGIQAIPTVIDTYSGGRIFHVPFYHPGYGIFTVISTLVHFTTASAFDALSVCSHAISNMQLGSTVAGVKNTWSWVSSTISTYPLASGLSTIAIDNFFKIWGVVSLPIVQVRSLLQTAMRSISNPVDIIKSVVYTLWVAYAACDSNLYVVRFFRAMAYGFGWYLIVPVMTGVADLLGLGGYVLGRVFIEPLASVFVFVFAGLLTPTQIRHMTVHIAQLSWEIQNCVIFVLHGIFSAVNGTKLAFQTISEYSPPSTPEEHPVNESRADQSSHVYYRINDLAFAGGLWGLVFVVYRYGPGVYGEVCNRWRAIMREPPATPRKQNPIQQAIAKQFMAVNQITTAQDYRCFHVISKQTKSPVFLKCLRSSSSKAARIGLAKEYRATRVLFHPNIIRFVTWIRSGQLCALALEYTPFGNLKCAMEAIQPRFVLKDRLTAFKQVLQAVRFLHNANAAHLNIRPGSILVFDKWSLMKLSGFSHTVKVSADLTCDQYNLHQVAGPTEAIIRRQPYDPFKADLWALGSLFFYIISGEYLHNKSNIPVPAILLPALKECDIRHQKIILSLLTSLLCYDPKGRPPLIDVIETLDEMEK